jgi:hypothetical protein
MEQLHTFYLKYRSVMMNIALLCAIVICFLVKSESVKSLAFGLAAGIALIELGESITRLRSRGTKAVSHE